MKSLLTFGAICLAILSFGQADYDQRLLAKYSKERLTKLIEKQPATIEYWTYYLDNSYTIVDGNATGKAILADEEVKIKNIEDFNILKLGIFMDGYATKYYSISGTNKYLALKSTDQFVKEFSRTKKVNN
ncbi:MAG: hypothetical protein AAGC47_00175 [Bacteroidota bacterium]